MQSIVHIILSLSLSYLLDYYFLEISKQYFLLRNIMDSNLEDLEKLYVTLVQNTPFVDDLILAFAKQDNRLLGGKINFDFLNRGSRQQKCRRFYDWLLHENSKVKKSFEQGQQLWKNFNNSGNAAALETLQLILGKQEPDVSTEPNNFSAYGISEAEHEPLSPNDDTEDTAPAVAANSFRAKSYEVERSKDFNFTIACRAARVGDVDKLNDQLNSCKQGDRRPLTESDWSSKTLLHNIVDQGLRHPNQLKCMDVLLTFAEKYNMKNALLDAKDLLNEETALHLAIKRESVVLCRKLLCEGADTLIKNRSGKSCLEMLYSKLPVIIEFLLDKSVATSGDTTGDLFDLSIDFGTVTGFVDTITVLEGKETGLVTEEDSERGKSCITINTRRSKQNGEESNWEDGLLLKDLPFRGISLDLGNEETEEKSRFPVVENSLHCIGNVDKNSRAPSSRIQVEGEMILLSNLIYKNPYAAQIVLSHPVVKTFLDLKWKKMKNIFRIVTVLQIFFCILFMWTVYDIYLMKCPLTTKKDSPCQWYPQDFALASILLICNCFFLLKEVFEARRISLLHDHSIKIYFHGFENCIQILFVILVCTVTIPVYCQKTFHRIQYGIAAFGILVSSILIVMVIGNSNQNFIVHSAYVHVYGVIMKRFLTVLITFSVVLVAFALSFSVVLGKQILSITELSTSLGKMFMMLAGEFNFDEIVEKHKDVDVEKNSQDPLLILAQLLYIVFAAFVTIVLIDVFLGYTISDIQDLKKRAEELWRSIQVEQLFIMEGVFESLRNTIQRYLSKDSKLLELVDTRVVIPKKKIMHINMMQVELTSFGVLVPFKDIQPQMRTDFRKMLCND